MLGKALELTALYVNRSYFVAYGDDSDEMLKTFPQTSDIEASFLVETLLNSLEYDLKRRVGALMLTKFARSKTSDPSQMRKQAQSSWL